MNREEMIRLLMSLRVIEEPKSKYKNGDIIPIG